MLSALHRLVARLSRIPRPTRLSASRRNRRTPLFLEALESRLAPATDVWTGAAAAAGLPSPDASWSNPQNWVGNAAPNPGDDLVFASAPASLASNNDFAPGTSFHSIAIAGNGYTITGNAVQLQAGLTTTNTVGGSTPAVNTVALPLTLAAGQTFTSTNAGTDLVLTGSLDNGGNLWTVTGSGAVLFAGPSIGGAGGLTKKGAGLLILQDANPDTFTGTTTVNAGSLILYGQSGNAIVGDLVIGNGFGGAKADVVRLAAGGQIANTSSVTVNSSGLLDLNGFNETIGPLTLSAGNVSTGKGTLILNGDVTTLAASATASISGKLSLGPAGTTTRTFTIANGDAGPDLYVSAKVSGPDGVELIKTGSGSLKLTGDNTYVGQTLVAHGKLEAASANALGGTGGTTTVNAGGILDYVNPTANSTYTFAAEPITLNGGKLEGSGSSATLVVPGPITLAADSVVTEDSGTTLSLTGKVTGPAGFTKTGSGAVRLIHANDYVGATVVNQGVLYLDNAQALGATGAASGTTVTGSGTLFLEGGRTYAPEALTLSGQGGEAALHSEGSNTWTGSVYLAASSNMNVSHGATLTVSGPISGPATSTFTAGNAPDTDDDGTVLLTSANTYAGATVVSYGTLAAATSTALGSPTSGTNKGTTVKAGATLRLQGGLTFDPTESLTLSGHGCNDAGALYNGSGNNTWAGSVSLAANAWVGAASGKTLTVTGVVSGPSTNLLGKVGNGTVALAAANTYAGATHVYDGTLALKNAAALGATTAGTTVHDGATLQLRGGLTYKPEYLTLNGTGAGGAAGALQNLSGANTWTGTISLGSAATIKSEAGSTLTVNGQVANGGYLLTIDTEGDARFNNTISGKGGLTKTGPGTLTFGGTVPNLYAGATVVDAGTLFLSVPSPVVALTGAGLTINAGATLAGTGIINTNVTNWGVVSPGGDGTVGTLTINGNYTQNAGGALNVELAGTAAFDQLMIAGIASLGGTLNVTLLNGFLPSAGDLYPILTFGSSTGAFTTLNLPSPANGVQMSVLYDLQDVTLAAMA